MHEGESDPRSRNEEARERIQRPLITISLYKLTDWQHLSGKQLREAKRVLATALAEVTWQHDVRQEQSHSAPKRTSRPSPTGA